MGDCIWCRNKAGWFSTEHKECVARRTKAIGDLRQRALAGAVGQSPVNVLKASLPAMQEQYVQDSEVRAALIAGYEDAVDSLLDDHVISEDEQSSLADYADALGLSRADLDRKGAYTNVGLGTVLREVTAGRLPQQQPMQGDLPFNFQKSEELVWTFQGVTLYEGRSRTRYEGGSPAVRVRVMKGVYLRQSAIRGDPVVTTELVHIDDGVVALTTKHLYFAGRQKSHRTPYTKITSFQPYSDGLGVQRDAASAKPQVYKLRHGWFAYNLMRSLAER